MGESKRRPPQNKEIVGKIGDDAPKSVGFYIRRQENRVVLVWEEPIDFVQMTGKDAVELGRALVRAGNDARQYRAPPIPEA